MEHGLLIVASTVLAAGLYLLADGIAVRRLARRVRRRPAGRR